MSTVSLFSKKVEKLSSGALVLHVNLNLVMPWRPCISCLVFFVAPLRKLSSLFKLKLRHISHEFDSRMS